MAPVVATVGEEAKIFLIFWDVSLTSGTTLVLKLIRNLYVTASLGTHKAIIAEGL
jgi:hypothetical protein